MEEMICNVHAIPSLARLDLSLLHDNFTWAIFYEQYSIVWGSIAFVRRQCTLNIIIKIVYSWKHLVNEYH